MPGVFRYIDRWQATVGGLWRADRDARDDASFARLIDRLEARDRDLETWLDQNVVQPRWRALTLTAPWVNYGTPWQVAQFRRVGDDVQVRGLVKSGVSGNVVATLPAGFRPPADVVNVTSVDVGGGNVFARLDVASSGAITPYFAAGTAAYLSINVRFSTGA